MPFKCLKATLLKEYRVKRLSSGEGMTLNGFIDVEEELNFLIDLCNGI
jgi:hypothetical protein